MLEELIAEARESGHRLLIFSQFTTMLSHIAERLRRSFAHFYLDGATAGLTRMKLVREFNRGAPCRSS